MQRSKQYTIEITSIITRLSLPLQSIKPFRGVETSSSNVKLIDTFSCRTIVYKLLSCETQEFFINLNLINMKTYKLNIDRFTFYNQVATQRYLTVLHLKNLGKTIIYNN